MTITPDPILLSIILDRVIPPVDDLPGAGQMGLADTVIEKSRADERFWSALVDVLDAFPNVDEFLSSDGDLQDTMIRKVEAERAQAFGLWLDVVYTIYYMRPEVHRWLNWHGRPPQPDGNVMPPWDESILETARKREPFWRKV